jgi:CubicO group peptidase (beta-lactamase class C family)
MNDPTPRSNGHRLRQIALALGLLGAFVASAACAPIPQRAETAGSPTAQRLRHELTDLGAFQVSGAVLVSDSGRALVRMGFGLATESGIRNTPATLFDIGSLAKQFTAAAILALCADGQLLLTDSVGRFFPSAPAGFAALRLTQLMSHTGGVTPGNLVDEENPDVTAATSRDTALARLFRSRLRTPASNAFSYSNAGFVLLAAIVEQASGRPYTAYVHDRLFQRAGMRQTVFWGERTDAPVANGFDDIGEKTKSLALPYENWTLRGAGGVLSSIDDLERWIIALTRGQVIPKALVDSMMTAKVSTPNYGSGYGWRIGLPGTPYAGAVFHGGDFLGFGTQLIWYPGTQRLIVILANFRDEADEYPSRIVIERVVTGALEARARDVPEVEQGSARDHSSIAGDYVSADSAEFRIVAGSRGYTLGARNQQAVNLIWSPPADTARDWQALSTRTSALFRAVLGRDTSGVRRVLAAKDDPPYWYTELSKDLPPVVTRANAASVTIRTLGTYPAVLPRGALWTMTEFSTGGELAFYRLRWYQDLVASLHQRATAIASLTPLARTRTGWIAWNPTHRTRPLWLVPSADRRTLVLQNSQGAVTLSRVTR